MRPGVMEIFLVMMAALLSIPSAFARSVGSLNGHTERFVFLEGVEASIPNAVAPLIPSFYILGKAPAISNIVGDTTWSIYHSYLGQSKGTLSSEHSFIDEPEEGYLEENLSAEFIFRVIPSSKRSWWHRFFFSMLSQRGDSLNANPKGIRTISLKFKLLEF
jgi:hypothetical protein